MPFEDTADTEDGEVTFMMNARGKSTLDDLLDSALNYFINTLSILKKSNELLFDALSAFVESKQKTIDEGLQQLDDEGKKQWEKLLSLGLQRGESFITNHPKLARVMGTKMEVALYGNRVPSLMKQMSIVYLVVAFQAFLRISLQNIFTHKPEILKGSHVSITAEEFFEHSNIDSITDIFIDKVLADHINQDPEAINEYLKNPLKLDLSTNSDWDTFKEIFYRRHAIIHNHSIADERYRRNTGSKGDKDLTVTDDYLVNVVYLFDKYANLIHDHFIEKFGGAKVKDKQGGL